MPGRRSKNRRPTQGPSQRSLAAVSYTVEVCGFAPKTRQLTAAWSRTIQERVAITSGTSTDFTANDWFADRYNTTGFSSVFVHSVTVWSSPSNPSKEDSVRVAPYSPKGLADSGWSAQGVSGQVNRSVAVKVRYPAHLSGPYNRSDKIFALTTTATSVIVELDCIFT